MGCAAYLTVPCVAGSSVSNVAHASDSIRLPHTDSQLLHTRHRREGTKSTRDRLTRPGRRFRDTGKTISPSRCQRQPCHRLLCTKSLSKTLTCHTWMQSLELRDLAGTLEKDAVQAEQQAEVGLTSQQHHSVQTKVLHSDVFLLTFLVFGNLRPRLPKQHCLYNKQRRSREKWIE